MSELLKNMFDKIAVFRGMNSIVKPLKDIEVRLSKFIENRDNSIQDLIDSMSLLESEKRGLTKEKVEAVKIKDKIASFFE